MTTPLLRRVARRETHAARTGPMAVVVVVLILLAGYALLETVVWLAGQPALLVGPGAAVAWLVALPTVQPTAAVIAGTAVVALVGLVLIVLGLAPGRLARHRMLDDDHAVVVDNGVIASAVAERLSEQTGVARDRIVVGVGHRRADVTVRTEPGVELDRAAVEDIATSELASYRLAPAVRVRARIVAPAPSRRDR